ncbi:MAG: AAA family ATPase [Endomicrobium sp.]|nr:AAA family ATPase [Endomicrobium sp.]
MRVLPIGIQSFKEIRENDYVYVDKTRFVLELINSGKFYFLSRPRRFGKSLLVSTLKELFQGKKQLFKGLYIYDKWDWAKTYPVIYLDFSVITYSTAAELKLSLNQFLDLTAEDNGV